MVGVEARMMGVATDEVEEVRAEIGRSDCECFHSE